MTHADEPDTALRTSLTLSTIVEDPEEVVIVNANTTHTARTPDNNRCSALHSLGSRLAFACVTVVIICVIVLLEQLLTHIGGENDVTTLLATVLAQVRNATSNAASRLDRRND